MKVNININMIEMMNFFWSSVSEGEKVAEPYIIEMANKEEMKFFYEEDFDNEGFRRVLSSISNREALNSNSPREKRFWNNNMWMTEDLGVMEMMIEPIKKLNLSDLENTIKSDKYDEINIYFLPGTTETSKIIDNNLIINFFSIQVDIFGGSGDITFEGKDFKERIEELIKAVA